MRTLDAAQRSLAPVRLFAWRENAAAIQAGSEAVDRPSRMLAGLYVCWQLALPRGEPVSGLAVGLRALAARPQAARLAEELAWQAWLDDPLAETAPGGTL